ncbi:hypothetical protein [Corynebacterium pygosceleis]|uniref:Uncharacterized protein n=1 Tax=Corynebacterium pygosceleis TaxID=2800406 RepID=A0A9Q4GJ07_9CORY|nr:hypothetical protein [Corynebacterium pygosceleis]MCK7638160.1 hypothetical protein [Corynebacterium pygosceleis]MCK7675873.1 hypothetical protein [Corynebacterium pygosceleis]MCL0120745.1 hypothetical protein [Corynebacterium pygosceleis]MCX7444285.1 hypothetical protein [Corynebacterium pygosceleis]MCX7468876.1 hypothetical protein [Corynebacterium pygosceleis]
MPGKKPLFTDVNRVEVSADVVNSDRGPVLSLDRLEADGSRTNLLLLNIYDAKHLSEACTRYRSQAFIANFDGFTSGLSAKDHEDIHGDD